NGENGPDMLDIFVRHCEEISVEHGEIGMVSGFNRAEVVLTNEPLVRGGSQPQHFLARQRLAGVDEIPVQILRGNYCVEVELRVDDGDVASVRVIAEGDTVVEQRPIDGSDVHA